MSNPQDNPPNANANALPFLLAPDANAARHLRRRLAEQALGAGVVVGTWPELTDWAARAYLVTPPPGDDWDRVFTYVLGQIPDAFWTESLAVAPLETAAVVEAALRQFFAATDPQAPSAEPAPGNLAARPRRHLADLQRLTDALNGRLPPDLALIQALLQIPQADALYPLRVLHVADVPWLSRWQQALIDKLNQDAGDSALDARLLPILEGLLDDTAQTPAEGALGVLQTQLFDAGRKKCPVDDSLQWVGVRDPLQEAEVAAGMAQSLLAAHPGLHWAQIGLLVPDDPAYHRVLDDAFHLAGIPLSGLPQSQWRRNLGIEAVALFLHCGEHPAPAMALAALLTSPLMPWSARQGRALAQAVMDGDRRLRPWTSQQQDAQPMLDLLQDVDGSAQALAEALERFGALLRAREATGADVKRAREAIAVLCDALTKATGNDQPPPAMSDLRRLLGDPLLPDESAADVNREGVTVWRASQEPWRPVQHLIVLGFTQGQYPRPTSRDAVLTAAEWEALRSGCGLPVRTPAKQVQARRQRFKRQLGQVARSATFLIPRRDALGGALMPSETLVFMHQLFTGPETADARVLDLDRAEDRARVRHLALAAAAPPQPPPALVTGDLQFDCDLHALRKDDNGQIKPESPSSLETLMVSSLAWLLARLDAKPRGWAPEATDPMVLGSLAHRVFEALFRPGQALPEMAALPRQVETLLDQAIAEQAPFFGTPGWQVERRHFCTQTAIAAHAWRELLAQVNATVLATETWLQGSWSGIAVHGQCDLLLALPGTQLAVVDYKRSTSRSRRSRMQKGYDSQASLYRTMLQSGGLKGTDDTDLAKRLASPKKTGVIYYTLNDQTVLSDLKPSGGRTVPGWDVLEGDLAAQAMALIGKRLGEVKAGRVRLNRDGDETFFEQQAGMSAYALEASPLIALFTKADDTEALG